MSITRFDERRAWVWSGLAALCFWSTLAGVGAARGDYSQLTKAVSELGAVGSPHALAWNVFGFIVPGVLLAACGAVIATALEGRRGSLRWLLTGSGLAFAGTGIFPAVMRHGSPVMQAPSTVGHVVMLLLSSVLWIVAVGVLLLKFKRNTRRRLPLKPVAGISAVALAGLLANVLHASIPLLAHRPGLAQRIGFAGYFLWYLSLSSWIAIATTDEADTDSTQAPTGRGR